MQTADPFEEDLFLLRDETLGALGWIEQALKEGKINRPREKHTHPALVDFKKTPPERKDYFRVRDLLAYFYTQGTVGEPAQEKTKFSLVLEEARFVRSLTLTWGLDTVLTAIDLLYEITERGSIPPIEGIQKKLLEAKELLHQNGFQQPLIKEKSHAYKTKALEG